MKRRTHPKCPFPYAVGAVVLAIKQFPLVYHVCGTAGPSELSRIQREGKGREFARNVELDRVAQYEGD
jgi:hypothetical protein